MWYLRGKGRRSYYLLVFVFILTGFTFYFFPIHEEALEKSISLFKTEEEVYPKGYLVFTPGCRIPEMNPFDKTVLPYLDKPWKIDCSQKLSLVESNQTSIWVVAEALPQYNVTDPSELDCCFVKFQRLSVDPEKMVSGIDDTLQMDELCHPFTESVNINSEFIRVTCVTNNVTVYEDFHAFIVPKPKDSPFGESKDNDLSVLIIGSDSTSRLNFLRQMPKTKALMDLLGAIEFHGYNKVEDNTFPNLVPLLSGFSVDEIKEFCWTKPGAVFDDCPWIWKNYSARNFYTAFGEDACWMGTFNYGRNGFLYPPTDYYIRPYMYAQEHFIGHTKLLNSYFCVGTRYAAQVLFDYTYKFSINMTLSSKKFWGIFWQSSLTHDYLNYPEKVDELYYDLFFNLDQSNVLNKTAVIFLSDHGMRWGRIRTTYQGRMEEHLPFLYILLPQWFKEAYPDAVSNLQRNTDLLTTPFDIHETLVDFLNLDNLTPENLASGKSTPGKSRGVSLFFPISVHRTCKIAGIEPSWCTCQRNKQISIADKNVKIAAKMTVRYLNKMLSSYKNCAKLKLKEVTSAYIEYEEENVGNSTKNLISDYVVTLVTTPGMAKFESVVRHHSHSAEMTVLGGISRLNIYGTQSRCVSHFRLKLYCYCI